MSRAVWIEVIAVRIAITFLGLDLFTLDFTTSDGGDTSLGESTSYPLGFTGYSGDQRWEQGAGGGEL